MRLLVSLTIIAILTAVAAFAEPGRLTVSGEGQVAIAPDMAEISLGVVTEDRSANAALKANSLATAAVLKRIDALGVEARDVQTTGLSLSPIWSNSSLSSANGREITGFVAHNQVTLRLRDLSRLGRVLDAVVQDGANTFGGLVFGLADPQSAKDQARELAVKDALRKAAILVKGAGVGLGPILEISESAGGGPYPMAMQEMALSRAVPVAEGELTITATVQMTFEIAQ